VQTLTAKSKPSDVVIVEELELFPPEGYLILRLASRHNEFQIHSLTIIIIIIIIKVKIKQVITINKIETSATACLHAKNNLQECDY
jgi:hypothetical protein